MKLRITVLEGQVSIFDIPQQTIVKKEIIEDDPKKEVNLLEKYMSSANRILKLFGGRYAIEFNNETIYLTREGKEDYKSEVYRSTLPMDEILMAKADKEVNSVQKSILEQLKIENNIEKVIKRFGDENYILITKDNKTIGINQKGWIIPYVNKPVYKNKDIVQKVIESVNETSKIVMKTSKSVNDIEKIVIGSNVEISYGGEVYQGVVTRIYGPGDKTVNVTFNGRHTAFFRDNIKLIS